MGDGLQLPVVAQPALLPSLKVSERALVLAQLKLAQAEHGPRSSGFWFQRRQTLKGEAPFGETLQLVAARAQRPPALLPLRTQSQGLPVKFDRLVQTSCRARRRCAVGKPVKSRGCSWSRPRGFASCGLRRQSEAESYQHGKQARAQRETPSTMFREQPTR